jgi:hypothetical protein
MANIDKVSLALSEWAFKVAKSILPQLNIPVGGRLAGMMQILGVNPATYSIWIELGFLAEPVIQTMVTPVVGKMLSGIPDEQVQELALKYVDAFVKQAQEKGSVNVFGIAIDESDLNDLREILVKRFKER